MDTHISERLKKLYALAEKGEPGERENAKALLEKLMEKYKVSETDFSDETLQYHKFHYTSSVPYEKRLLDQVIFKICPHRTEYRLNGGKGSRSTLVVKCTRAEAVQIQIEFEFYAKLWEEEQALFFHAFIAKHEIYDRNAEATVSDMSEDEYLRMKTMMIAMQDKFPAQLIEEHTGSH